MNNKIKSWVLKSIVISLLFQSFSIQAQELKQKLSDFTATERPWLWCIRIGATGVRCCASRRRP